MSFPVTLQTAPCLAEGLGQALGVPSAAARSLRCAAGSRVSQREGERKESPWVQKHSERISQTLEKRKFLVQFWFP